MNITTFAKPGEKNVIDPDYRRKVRVDGVSFLVSLEPGCWSGNLAIYVDGPKRFGSGIFRSRRAFSRAVFADLEKLIKGIRLAPCRMPACKGRYVAGNFLAFTNPKKFCRRHWGTYLHVRAVKAAAKQNAMEQKSDAAKKSRGYRYKAIVWIHRDDRDDTAVRLYFKKKPSRGALAKEARARKSRLMGDVTVTRL